MIEEGTQCRGVVMVLRGVIRVYQLREDGREMTLYRVGPGQLCVLTVACMMGAVDYPVIAEVEDEDAHVIVLTQVLFRRLFNSDPEWQRYIFSAMADRLMELMVILGGGVRPHGRAAGGMDIAPERQSHRGHTRENRR